MAVKVEMSEFLGHKAVTLSNGNAELIVITGVGPRIISLSAYGGANHFCVRRDQLENPAQDAWNIFGGHRLWVSPELAGRSDEPDNVPVQVELLESGVRVSCKSDVTLTERAMTVTLDKKAARVSVVHEIKNLSMFDIELSAWALSVMDAGGLLAVEQISEDTGLLPNRSLSLWPYSAMNDSRVYWGDRFITLNQDKDAAKPFKLGMPADKGYAAYFNHGQLVVKRFEFDPEAIYPDFGCNFEAYTCDFMLESESLSPLELLAPGQSVTHVEEWEIFDKVSRPAPRDENAIAAALEGRA